MNADAWVPGARCAIAAANLSVWGIGLYYFRLNSFFTAKSRHYSAMVGGLAPPCAQGEEDAKKAAQHGVIFVLEEAQLEVAQVGKVSACRHAEVH